MQPAKERSVSNLLAALDVIRLAEEAAGHGDKVTAELLISAAYRLFDRHLGHPLEFAPGADSLGDLN